MQLFKLLFYFLGGKIYDHILYINTCMRYICIIGIGGRRFHVKTIFKYVGRSVYLNTFTHKISDYVLEHVFK